MRIKSIFTILLSKCIITLSSKIFKGGTNFPGRVALKLDKTILKDLGKNYEVILITGTNGKTTTTNMIYSMLKESGKFVITNSTGANMLPGIVSCFIKNYSFKNSSKIKYAVIEVDEANVPLVTTYLTPKIISITNLFRDQLDRYGEVYTTLKKILEGVEKVPSTTLVLNGDESLLGDLSVKNPVSYYGFDCTLTNTKKVDLNADAKFCKKCKAPYKYHYLTYNHLGNFYCEACGYERPPLQHKVNKILELTPSGSSVEMDYKEYYINQPGTYNIYNALCAYSIAKELQLENEIIESSLKLQATSFGRQESISVDGKEVKIILVKNPAGYDEALNTLHLDKRSINIAFLLNDNYADGRDVSWIWDVHFESLTNLSLDRILLSGIRLYDMAIRLKTAGLPKDHFRLCTDHEILLKEIQTCETTTVYVLATYTAMIQFRKFLHSKGYIKKLW